MSNARDRLLVLLTLAGFAAGMGGISVFSGCQDNLFPIRTPSPVPALTATTTAIRPETSESASAGTDMGFGLPGRRKIGIFGPLSVIWMVVATTNSDFVCPRCPHACIA